MKPRSDIKIRIGKYLADEKILLTGEEEAILQRWEKANDLLVEKKLSYTEIRDALRAEFRISRSTAENDISNAQDVFGASRKINKRFLMHMHLDRMDRDIEAARKAIFFYIDDAGNSLPRTPDAKELMALAKLEETYTYSLNSVNQDDDRDKKPPPIFMFNLPEGVAFPLAQLDNLLKATDQYIDFEMTQQNGTEDSQPKRSTGKAQDDAAAAHDDPAVAG